ncbi:MAG: hypothetical protein AB8F95_19260 [Bacteroidia bacterium]
MNTEIAIKSDLFPSYPNEEDDINPGVFGKRLAEYVKQALEKNGVAVADLYTTDHSYELRLDQFDFTVYIQLRNEESEENRFILFIDPQKPFIRKFFKKIPTTETIKKVYDTILNAFQNDQGIDVLSSY